MSDWTWADWIIFCAAFALIIGLATWAWAHPGSARKGGDGE